MCEIYSKLAEKKSTGVSIINFEQISHISWELWKSFLMNYFHRLQTFTVAEVVLVSLFLTFNIFHTIFYFFIDFEQVNVCWLSV